MDKVKIQDGTVHQVLEMERSVQVISNAGFLLGHSEPLTPQQREYSTMLDTETQKLAETFSQSFVNTDNFDMSEK